MPINTESKTVGANVQIFVNPAARSSVTLLQELFYEPKNNCKLVSG